ncbi:MAG: archease [Chloroflexi bacterium]|nr:archease [Chloroflexota bacterium]
MPYEYLDHTADVGLRGRGRTLAEALTHGALGLFHLMVDLERVVPQQEVPIECAAGDPAALFVELLNELLARRDIEGMFFGDFEITCLEQDEDGYRLQGVARGEPMDIERHQPKVEVKAATYGGLRHFVDENGQHVVQCVLDL